MPLGHPHGRSKAGRIAHPPPDLAGKADDRQVVDKDRRLDTRPPSRLIARGPFDALDDVDVALSRQYAASVAPYLREGFTVAASNPGRDAVVQTTLQEKLSSDPSQHADVVNGLLYAILTVELPSVDLHDFSVTVSSNSGTSSGVPAAANISARLWSLLCAVCRDGFAAVVATLQRLCIEKWPKLLPEVSFQLLWVLDKAFNGLWIKDTDAVFLCLLRQVASADLSDGNIWLAGAVLGLLQGNMAKVYRFPNLLTGALFTYLRVLSDHMASKNATVKALAKNEVGFCVQVLRERLQDCIMIGRDLIRLLQDVSSIPEFEALWADLVHRPESFGAPGFTDLGQLYGVRTPTRYIASRVTPEMEQQLRFVLTHVRMGEQRRYQTWFAQKYLSSPESESLVCDLIRFICCVIHPTNQILQSDVVPRWAVIGWLLKCCRSVHVESNGKLALFYDWLFFSPRTDNIMNIEPAILCIFYSLPKYAELSNSLLEFLFFVLDFYDTTRKDMLLRGISNAVEVLVTKGVVPNLHPISESSHVPVRLRERVHQMFPSFCRSKPASLKVPTGRALPPSQSSHPGQESQQQQQQQQQNRRTPLSKKGTKGPTSSGDSGTRESKQSDAESGEEGEFGAQSVERRTVATGVDGVVADYSGGSDSGAESAQSEMLDLKEADLGSAGQPGDSFAHPGKKRKRKEGGKLLKELDLEAKAQCGIFGSDTEKEAEVESLLHQMVERLNPVLKQAERPLSPAPDSLAIGDMVGRMVALSGSSLMRDSEPVGKVKKTKAELSAGVRNGAVRIEDSKDDAEVARDLAGLLADRVRQLAAAANIPLFSTPRPHPGNDGVNGLHSGSNFGSCTGSSEDSIGSQFVRSFVHLGQPVLLREVLIHWQGSCREPATAHLLWLCCQEGVTAELEDLGHVTQVEGKKGPDDRNRVAPARATAAFAAYAGVLEEIARRRRSEAPDNETAESSAKREPVSDESEQVEVDGTWAENGRKSGRGELQLVDCSMMQLMVADVETCFLWAPHSIVHLFPSLCRHLPRVACGNTRLVQLLVGAVDPVSLAGLETSLLLGKWSIVGQGETEDRKSRLGLLLKESIMWEWMDQEFLWKLIGAEACSWKGGEACGFLKVCEGALRELREHGGAVGASGEDTTLQQSVGGSVAKTRVHFLAGLQSVLLKAPVSSQLLAHALQMPSSAFGSVPANVVHHWLRKESLGLARLVERSSLKSEQDVAEDDKGTVEAERRLEVDPVTLVNLKGHLQRSASVGGLQGDDSVQRVEGLLEALVGQAEAGRQMDFKSER